MDFIFLNLTKSSPQGELFVFQENQAKIQENFSTASKL
jgi:hypothetical protein